MLYLRKYQHISAIDTLNNISRACPLIPIVLLLLNVKKLKEKGIWVIFVYLCYSVITEIINFYLQTSGRSSDFNFNLFSIIEYCLLTYYIREELRSKILKRVVIGCSVIFLVMSTVRLFGAGHHEYDSVSGGVEAIFLIIFAIFYLFEQISKPDHIFFYAIPEFWVIVAILLYFSATFFLNIYAESLLHKSASFNIQYSLITDLSAVLQNLLFGVAMIVKGDDKSVNLSKMDRKNLDEHLNLNR
jgi:hypothetical protein